jgi:predicted nucleic acid-binding protein
MPVLVDTTIWSLALRRRPASLNSHQAKLVKELKRLIEEGQVVLIGPVRQEILSGVRRKTDFALLRARLNSFTYVGILPDDYDRAAEFFNACQTEGVTGTSVDLLICAVAARLKTAIFTTDRDFVRYARVLSVNLHRAT